MDIANSTAAARLAEEMHELLNSRKSMLLATRTGDGEPYASYAPFAFDDQGFFILISEIALHAVYLREYPKASLLVIEDEDNAAELFARKRINYQVKASLIAHASQSWAEGIRLLEQRHGARISQLSQLADFKLFRLEVESGRYVKGFGKAFAFQGPSVTGSSLGHLRDGHRTRV